MIKSNKVGSIGYLSFSSLRLSIGSGGGVFEHDETVSRKVLIVLGTDRVKKYQLVKDSNYDNCYFNETDQECLNNLKVE